MDFGFALLIGLIFRYAFIAPVSGEYVIITVQRAIKADFLSLAFFEMGLFGWMPIWQIAVFRWRLEVGDGGEGWDETIYWWGMQVCFFGVELLDTLRKRRS